MTGIECFLPFLHDLKADGGSCQLGSHLCGRRCMPMPPRPPPRPAKQSSHCYSSRGEVVPTPFKVLQWCSVMRARFGEMLCWESNRAAGAVTFASRHGTCRGTNLWFHCKCWYS